MAYWQEIWVIVRESSPAGVGSKLAVILYFLFFIMQYFEFTFENIPLLCETLNNVILRQTCLTLHMISAEVATMIKNRARGKCKQTKDKKY